jgi:prolyl oligopeptidase
MPSASMRAASAALCALLLTSIAATVRAQSAPPPAPKREVVDTYFGTAIADPYRWMEKPIAENPEFRRWLEAQNAYTRAVLDPLPQLAPLKSRLAELADIVTAVPEVRLAGPRWFYLKLQPGEQTPKLYVREQSGRERMLLDPDTLPGAGDSHWAIDYITPAPDGRLVGYGASVGGSEKTTLHLMDASTGRLLPDSISRVQFGEAVAWAPDRRSFYYIRMNAAGDTNPAQRYRNSAAWRHIVGRPVQQDELMLGPGSSSTVPLEPDDFPAVMPVEGSPYIFASVIHGVRNEITLYVARASDFRGSATSWRRLVDTGDAVVAAEPHGSEVYLLSHKDAPRFRLLRVRADAPSGGRCDRRAGHRPAPAGSGVPAPIVDPVAALVPLRGPVVGRAA